MNRFIANLPQADYLADNLDADVPLFSSSMAQTMLEESPWHAHRKHPRLGAVDVPAKRPQKLGTALHASLLGLLDEIEVLRFDNYRTKAAQEARDNATAAGKTPVLEREWAELRAAVDPILTKLRRRGIDLPSMKRELTAVWHERTDKGHLVACKGRFDAFDGRTIWDVKSTNDISPAALERSIVDYGYHVQGVAYVSAADTINVRMQGRHNFGLIFVEKETYAVRVVRLDGTFREWGRIRWETAVDAWRRCLASNHWPLDKDETPYVAKCPEWHKIATDRQVMHLKELTWKPEVVG